MCVSNEIWRRRRSSPQSSRWEVSQIFFSPKKLATRTQWMNWIVSPHCKFKTWTKKWIVEPFWIWTKFPKKVGVEKICKESEKMKWSAHFLSFFRCILFFLILIFELFRFSFLFSHVYTERKGKILVFCHTKWLHGYSTFQIIKCSRSLSINKLKSPSPISKCCEWFFST